MKLKRFLLFFFIILLCGGGTKIYADPTTVRIGGVDRYDTALKISQSSFTKSNYVILVQGEEFVDALCAAPLSKKYDAPILLVKQTGLDSDLLNEISRLNATNAIIIGGKGVVPSSVEDQLKNMNIDVKRFDGVDRFETSSKIAEEIGVANGAAIVSGENFPDALSIASIAASKQMPILLVQAAYIPKPIEDFININNINKFYVVGGKGVIYDSTISKLNNAKRLSGENRYETNLAVVNEFKDSINFDPIYVASGETFPDALGGAAIAAASNSAILITDSYNKGILDWLKKNMQSINNIKILGGPGAVLDSMIPKLINPSMYSRKVLGYATYYYYGAKENYNVIFNNYDRIDEIATDTYATDGTGNLIATKGYNSAGSLVDLIPTEQIALAKSKNISTYVMITNGFSADVARTLLRNPVNRQNLINNTLAAMKSYNYNGVNVDIEGIYSSDREYFTQFMKELYSELKLKGYGVTIAVPAKTSDSLTNSWSGGYDYKEIAKYADEITIMTYDEHWSGGSPGPIASINWVNDVIRYSITAIPKEKILLGLASYGYDWGTNVKSKAYTLDQANNVASNHGASIIFDNVSKSPHYDYTENGVKHSVWFENHESIGYKLGLVNSYDLGGIAIWSLGQTNSDYWRTIRTNLNK